MSVETSLAAAAIEVLHHDDHLLIVSKPSGLASQAGRDGGDGLIELVHRSGLPQAHLHHRLDQPASGVLALALSPLADRCLAAALRHRTAERCYLAVLASPVEQATWTAPIEGRSARTHVEALGPFRGLQPVQVRIETGRTHQIRRHAAMAGAPIVGDQRYGGEAGRGWPRLALHAVRLALPHPATGVQQTFIAPLPGDLVELWRLAGGPRGWERADPKN